MALASRGWSLTSDALDLCSKNGGESKNATDHLERFAVDLDLRESGLPVLPDEVAKGKVVKLRGPVVLQVQKVRNVSAPKLTPESSHSPRLLRLELTDGHLKCSALEVAPIPQLSMSLVPGTKVRLTPNELVIVNGFIMLQPSDISVLGGHVEKLALKWELSQSLAKHTRQTDEEEGPPPFVPFGKKIAGKQAATSTKERTGKYAKLRDASRSAKEDTSDVRLQIDPSSLATADRREPQRSSKDGNVSRLVEMGFSQEDSIRALQKCRGDPETAIDMLTGCTSMEVRKHPPNSAKTFGPRQDRGRQARPFSSASLVEHHVADVEEFGTTEFHRGGHRGRPTQRGGRGRTTQDSRAQRGRGYKPHRQQQWSHQSKRQSPYGDDYDHSDGTEFFPSQPVEVGSVHVGSYPTTVYNSQRRGQGGRQRGDQQRQEQWLDRPEQDLASSVKGLSLNEGQAPRNQISSRNSRKLEFSGQPKPSAALAEALRMQSKPSS